MYEFRKVGHNELILPFLLTIFILKICNSAAIGEESAKSSNDENGSLTQYYQNKPYGDQTYAFGFEVNDNKTGNRQFRDERRFSNGTVDGSYGYLRPDGKITVTHFIADSNLGYLSKTSLLDPTNKSVDKKNWHAEYLPNNVAEIFMPHTSDQTTTIALPTEQNIEINHIDLTKDLLSPSLWNIVSGKVPLKEMQSKDGEGKQLGFETFEKVIPKDFPIVPFELPETPNKGNFEEASNANETITVKMPVPKPLEKIGNETDWISKVVNETRKEFLENLSNLL